MHTRKQWVRFLLVVAVVGVAFGFRAWAAYTLPVDWDEAIYGGVATHYAGAIRNGNLDGIMEFTGNHEHPRFFKLLYGVVLAFELPISPHWEWAVSLAEPPPVAEFPHFYTVRLVSVVLGSLLVLLIALANPLAGLLLAVHTYSIKYTAQVYLEALPFLLSALAVFAYLRSERKKKGWLVLSGVLLGFTAGSKYVYALVGIVILLDWLRAHITAPRALRPGLRKELLRVLMWGGIALITFVASDPYLWPDVFERVAASVRYHLNFQQGEYVTTVNYPWWQPMVWLTQSAASHPDVTFVDWHGIDCLLPGLALLGLVRMWRKQPVFVVWLAVGLIFLMVWGTKWPQYILVVAVPLVMCAAEGAAQLRDWLQRLLKGRVQENTGGS